MAAVGAFMLAGGVADVDGVDDQIWQAEFIGIIACVDLLSMCLRQSLATARASDFVNHH